MNTLILQRGHNAYGMLSKMECYIDDNLVCKLKCGERQSFELNSNIFTFKCHLTNNPWLKPVTIEFDNCNYIQINIDQGNWRPKISIQKSSHNLGSAFSPTQIIGNVFAIDEDTHQWAVSNGLFKSFHETIRHPYDDILSFELLENGTSVTRGGIGRAVAGGLLFGSTGAVVGGITGRRTTSAICNSLKIKITLNRTDSPTEYVELIKTSTPQNSIAYQTARQNAQKILSLLEIICNSKSTSPENSISITDELRKAKALLDDGIITEDEFNQLKNKLLN